MNKNILAIAIAAAVAAPSAFAAATVYGVAHMGVASQDDGTESQFNVLSNSSRLGIKGDEDLGSGLKAVYQVEMAVGMDGEDKSGSGNMGAKARNTFVGLGGGFGTVLMGRHDSPIKLVGRSYDLFGDQVGNSRNITGSGAIGGTTNVVGSLVDGRHSNVLAYASPSFGGFSALLAYVPGAMQDDEKDTSDKDKGDGHSAMLNFKAGAFDAAASYIAVNTKNNALGGTLGNGAKDFTAYRLGAGYTFGSAKVVALYQNDNTMQVAGGKGTRDVFGLGGSYQVTSAGTIKAQYYTAGNWGKNAKATGADLWNIGYDHALSKNTTAYVSYALMNNDKFGTYSANTGSAGSGDNFASTTNPTSGNSKDNSAFSVGLIHKF